MASLDDGNSAVSLIRSLLSGDSKEAITEFSHCLGRTKNGEGRRCANVTHKRADQAASEYSNLLDKPVLPGDESTFASIVNFLNHRHCHVHQTQALAKFQTWQVENGFRGPSDSAVGGIPENKYRQYITHHRDEDMTVATTLPTKTSPATPQGKLYPVTADSMAEDFSDLTISPGQESTITLSDVSIASTTLTTPDETPVTLYDFPMMDETDSPPGTPTRAPRWPTDQIMDQDLEEDPDAREVMEQEDAKGPEMKEELIKRMKTQRRGKLPLLIGIEHDWTIMDHYLGRVYIFQHDDQAGLIKIGFTKGTARERYAQSGNCYAVGTTPYWESKDAFIGAYRVEQLVQKQLHENNILQHQSRCGHCHREWFRYDAEKAVELIKMWTQFVQDGFYDLGVDASGNKYGRLSQKGRDFMNGVCKVNVDVLRQLISKVPDVCPQIPETGEDNSSIADRRDPGADPVAQQTHPVEGLQGVEGEGDHSQMSADGPLTAQDQEKQGAKYHAKQALTITIQEIRELVPRKLSSFLGRRSTGGNERPNSKPSELEMSLQRFIGTFYANELDDLGQAPESLPRESKKGLRDVKQIYRQLRRKS